MNRKPAVAGSFYSGTKKALQSEIMACARGLLLKPLRVLGAVSPHAGFVYSGSVAAQVLANIETPETFIILGPNHTGRGRPASIMTRGSWSTPLGEVEIDRELADTLLKNSSFLENDSEAHEAEHSIEVQLPFLQYFHKAVKFVPVCLGGASFEQLLTLGEETAGAVIKSGKKVCIIASSDMTHYEPQEIAEKKDKLAINAILELDEKKLYETVRANNISMCGAAPAVAMLAAAKKLGAKKAELVKYTTSGETSGDYEQVVGYAGIVIA